jgi:hypothetical protein
MENLRHRRKLSSVLVENTEILRYEICDAGPFISHRKFVQKQIDIFL